MKMVFATVALVAAATCATSAQAQMANWQTCVVTICGNGQCSGPNSNLIVVSPANFADPGFGGEAVMIPQLKALAERLYPTAQGWSHQPNCVRSLDEERAMKEAKAYIALAKMPPASNEIKIAAPQDVWKYSNTTATATATASTSSSPPEKAGQQVAKPEDKKGGGEPMHFLLYVGLREPIGGVNANCFSNIITLPAPEGYRGQWPTLKNALPLIQSYFPAFQAECAKRGTVYGAVGFMTDDVSPSQAMIKMNATIGEWRGYRFPEVYVAK